MAKMQTPNPLSQSRREFTLHGFIVLSAAERAEREAQLSRPKPERGTNHSSDYQCPELNGTPGIPESRFRAFHLPSRRGDLLHYPDGRVEPIPEQSSSQPVAR